jgi:hypothetical protein
MPPDLPRATPEQLTEAPELAALEILDRAADATARALLAANPELLERDFLLEHSAVTPQLCLGAAVLSSIELLSVAVERYRVNQEQLAAMRLREADTNDF